MRVMGSRKIKKAIQDRWKDITECCLCNEAYNDPRILPCFHTFCMKCLEDDGGKISNGPGDQMPCPVCRKEFTIPEDGYTALQKNFFIEKIMELDKIGSSSGGPGLCEACMGDKSESTSVSEVPLADMYCVECEQKLCEECSRHHSKNKVTRSHEVVAAADFQSKVQILRQSNCKKHEKEHMLYCSECKELLCISCFGESHQNHRLQDVRSTVEDFRNEIRDRISCFDVCESKIFEKKDILNCEFEEYCENAESLELEVLAQRDATIKLVNDHADLILQDIYQFKEERRSQIQADITSTGRFLVWLKSLKVYCADVMTKGSASDICCAVNRLKAAEEIKEQIESEIEIKTFLRKMSFQISDLEEFVKTEDFNIIGTVQECQRGEKAECEAETASDSASHHGDIKMEDNCGMPISGNNGILTRMNHLKQELENERRQICELELEKKALEERVNGFKLEFGIKRPRRSTSGLTMAKTAQPLSKQVPPPNISIDYKQPPNLMKTIQGGDGSFDTWSIFGLTILDDELFLGCCMADIDHSIVEVYDIETFSFKRRWPVKNLSQSNTGVAHIRCMASCTRYKCLYACVSTVRDFMGCDDPVIQRTDVNGSNGKEWKIYGGTRVSDLSVTGEGNVLVITATSLLIEYSRDGVLVHGMELPSNSGIEHPLHALKLGNGKFVVSHGLGHNSLHRVLVLSKSGHITKSYGEMPVPAACISNVKPVPEVCEQKHLNEPVHLAVDGFGNILVADLGNNRIVVLNSNLELEGSIVPTPLLQRPRFLCVDADRGRLFVCEDLKKVSVLDFSF